METLPAWVGSLAVCGVIVSLGYRCDSLTVRACESVRRYALPHLHNSTRPQLLAGSRLWNGRGTTEGQKKGETPRPASLRLATSSPSALPPTAQLRDLSRSHPPPPQGGTPRANLILHSRTFANFLTLLGVNSGLWRQNQAFGSRNCS